MRILLHNSQIGLYYVGPEHWTSDIKKAANLHASAATAEPLRSQKLAHTQIVIWDNSQRKSK